MKRFLIVCVLMAVSLPAWGIGASPRYVEELRVGGGYGEAVDGGVDIEKDGDILADTLTLGTPLGVGSGGTGAATAETARSGLGLAIGTNIEAWDNDLDDLAGLTHTARNIVVSDGTDWTSRAMQAADVPTLNQDTTGDADSLLTKTWASPAAIGTGTPAPITGTALTGTSLSLSGAATFSSVADANYSHIIDSSSITKFTSFTVKKTAAGGEASITLQTLGSSFPGGTYCGQNYADLSALIFESCAAGIIITAGETIPLILGTNNVARVTITAGTVTVADDFIVSGGDITAGVNGTTRGRGIYEQGAGGNTPGDIQLHTANGTVTYGNGAADGSWHTGLSAPTADGTNLFQTINPASPPAFGGTAPAAGTFTTLTATGMTLNTTITTWPADTVQPSVAGGNVFKVPATWTTGNNIIDFSDDVAGQRILIIGGDVDCIVTDSGNLRLSGSWTAGSDDTLELFYNGSNWFEISRSNN